MISRWISFYRPSTWILRRRGDFVLTRVHSDIVALDILQRPPCISRVSLACSRARQDKTRRDEMVPRESSIPGSRVTTGVPRAGANKWPMADRNGLPMSLNVRATQTISRFCLSPFLFVPLFYFFSFFLFFSLPLSPSASREQSKRRLVFR